MQNDVRLQDNGGKCLICQNEYLSPEKDLVQPGLVVTNLHAKTKESGSGGIGVRRAYLHNYTCRSFFRYELLAEAAKSNFAYADMRA